MLRLAAILTEAPSDETGIPGALNRHLAGYLAVHNGRLIKLSTGDNI